MKDDGRGSGRVLATVERASGSRWMGGYHS